MAKVVVMHTEYGCDTGCCGHVVQVDGKNVPGSFSFNHPWGQKEFRKYAEGLVRQELGEEHVKDLDWENSWVTED